MTINPERALYADTVVFLRSKKAEAAVIVCITITLVLGAILGYSLLAPRSSTQTLSSESGSSSTTSATVRTSTNGETQIVSVLSSDGLQLTASVNATSIRSNENVTIAVSISNSLPANNSLVSVYDWAFQGVPVALWSPCYFELPAQVAVLQGNLTAQQVASAATHTFAYSCNQGVSVDQLTFLPNSTIANLTGVNQPGNILVEIGAFNLSLNFSTNGSWDLKALSTEVNVPIIGDTGTPAPSTVPFTSGVYTVAVEDEWGQVAVVHFTVSS